MDITTDGFGYMLAFGDLSWVPFIYSLQVRGCALSSLLSLSLTPLPRRLGRRSNTPLVLLGCLHIFMHRRIVRTDTDLSQARYLVDHDPALPLWQVALVAGVHFLGYYIFRGANR